jgi:hypothetical protein
MFTINNDNKDNINNNDGDNNVILAINIDNKIIRFSISVNNKNQVDKAF